MSCKYLSECPSPREVGTGPIYKRHFCMHHCQRCARFALLEHDPDIALPRWIRPTMMAHADQIIDARRNGFRALPSQAPRQQTAMIHRGPAEKTKVPPDNWMQGTAD